MHNVAANAVTSASPWSCIDSTAVLGTITIVALRLHRRRKRP